MPSPVAHGLAGLTVHLLTSRDRTDLAGVRHAAVAVVAAVAPDLDLLLRFVDGRNHHQAESHSIGAALLAAAAVALGARMAGWPRAPGGGATCCSITWAATRIRRSGSRSCGPSIPDISSSRGHYSWTSGVH